MFNFEKLEAWHKAIALADVIYSHTRNFPADERFGLTNQMRRSTVSVSSNIAEAEDFKNGLRTVCRNWDWFRVRRSNHPGLRSTRFSSGNGRRKIDRMPEENASPGSMA